MHFAKSLFALLILTSVSASAGSISLILRADSDSTAYNPGAQAAAPANVDSTRYFIHTGRLEYKGQLNDSVSFYTRLRFENVANNTPNKTDSLSDSVDIVQITHRITDDLSLTLGKISTEILADDGIPLAEIYLGSRARADVANTYLYGTGAKLAKTFSDQEIKIMTLDQFETTTTEQTRSAYGIVYKAKFFDKTLMPTLSYHKDHRQSEISGQDPTVEMIAVGLKYDPKPYAISLDYLQNTRDNMSGSGATAIAAANKKNIIGSYLLDASYQIDPQWTLRTRVDLATKTAQDNNTNTELKTNDQGISFVTEYKPFKDDYFRYHLAWTQLTEKPPTGSDQITQHIILGALIML